MRRRAGAVRVQERHLQWHPTPVQVRAGQRHRCPRHLERLVLLPHRRGHHGREQLRSGAAGRGEAVRVRLRHRHRPPVRVRRHGSRQGAQEAVRRARHHQRGRRPRLLRRRQRPAGDRTGPPVGDAAAARGRLRDDRQPGLRVPAADRQGDLEPGRAGRRTRLGRSRPWHHPGVVRRGGADPPGPDAG